MLARRHRHLLKRIIVKDEKDQNICLFVEGREDELTDTYIIGKNDNYFVLFSKVMAKCETALIAAIKAIEISKVSGDPTKNSIQWNNIERVNAADRDGNTPLHHAVEVGRYSVIIKLMNIGANVDARNNNGDTPSDLAAHKGYTLTKRALERRLELQKEHDRQYDSVVWMDGKD